MIVRRDDIYMTTIKNKQLLCTRCGKNEGRQTHPWCLSCYREYKQGWDCEHVEHNKEYKKEWKEEHKGYYLYTVKKGKDVQYVGATENITERMYSHLNLNSNIADLIDSEWDCIKYIDLTELLDDRIELLYLENFLMDLYNTSTKYNSKYNRIPEEKIDKLKMFCLINMIHSTEFSTYMTREEYLRKKDKKK
ncbi:TPA: GIY-YIG nuclease family protein [Clostridium perfringens]